MGRRRGGELAIARALLVLSCLGFVVSVFARPERGQYDPWLDAGAYNVPFAVAMFACWVRSGRDEARRSAWRALAFGLALYLGGNLYGSLVVGDQEIYPSPADGMWLGFYAMVYVAIVLFVRSQIVRFHPSNWLDGAIAGLGAAALVVAFVLGPVLADTGGRPAVVITNLCYPTSEILLIILLVTAGTGLRTQAWSWWMLAVGLAVFCVGDVVYLFEEAAGTYTEGGPLDVVWPIGVVIVGLAACLRTPPPSRAQEPAQRFLVPTVFTTTSIGLLVLGQNRHLPWVAVGLAIAAVAAAAARTALTVREVRSLAMSRQEARTDELTGLANRRAFTERLEAQLASDPSLAVMIIDLDGFKEINDSLGHDVGDDLLHLVADRLGRELTAGCLARLGGDEYGAFEPVTGIDDAVSIAQRALGTLDEPFDLDGMLVRVGASIGVAIAPLHGRGRSELLRFADIAMYDAKRSRLGVGVYNAASDPNTPERLRQIEDLREAIEQRMLELHYQPTIDMASGSVHGVEALVRWRRADGTLRYPDAFIPQAERVGLITALTRAVLDMAVSDFAILSRDHPWLSLSVNISGHDLLDERLAEYARNLCDRHALRPHQLTLEITETALVADIDRARRSISALRSHGIRVSVDDFGVGYSSMAQLITLEVDELKIDKCFVMRVDSDDRMQAIVRSTVALGRALNLDLVAEGVESQAAFAVLHELGCDVAQGYHISRPLPHDGLIDFLATHRIPPPRAPATPPTGRDHRSEHRTRAIGGSEIELVPSAEPAAR